MLALCSPIWSPSSWVFSAAILCIRAVDVCSLWDSVKAVKHAKPNDALPVAFISLLSLFFKIIFATLIITRTHSHSLSPSFSFSSILVHSMLCAECVAHDLVILSSGGDRRKWKLFLSSSSCLLHPQTKNEVIKIEWIQWRQRKRRRMHKKNFWVPTTNDNLWHWKTWNNWHIFTKTTLSPSEWKCCTEWYPLWCVGKYRKMIACYWID